MIVRLLAYRNLAHMGDYEESVAFAAAGKSDLGNGSIPDITQTGTSSNVKYGFGLNMEQALGDEGDTGVFLRYGWNDGRTESFAYTEADRALSFGGQISGKHWRRPNDRLAIAFAQDDLSTAHKNYLAAGGSGFILGDGALSYGPEQILETYYNFQATKRVTFGLDYQWVNNPGYNQARGSASVVSARFHFEF